MMIYDIAKSEFKVRGKENLKVNSEEIIRGSLRNVGFLVSWRWVELEEGVFQVLVDLHDGRFVSASVAVVGRREDGHYVSLLAPVVAVHDQLVGPGDELQVVRVVELLRDVLAEGVAGSSRRNSPAAPVVGVGPKQVAHGPLVRHFLHSGERLDLVERVDAGREAAVQTKYLGFHHGCDGQIVEEVCEAAPHVGDAVFSETLVVEAVDLRDLTGLVVSPQNRHSLLEPHLHGVEQSHRLNRVLSAVHIVAHEKVIGLRDLASDSEQLSQIQELAVDVAADGHWPSHALRIRLFHQY